MVSIQSLIKAAPIPDLDRWKEVTNWDTSIVMLGVIPASSKNVMLRLRRLLPEVSRIKGVSPKSFKVIDGHAGSSNFRARTSWEERRENVQHLVHWKMGRNRQQDGILKGRGAAQFVRRIGRTVKGQIDLVFF